ncbi:MAG: class B sortase [Lachnospiraceae bacterium]|nr:class B sortase [Lachnospiraceae bacterium]
MKRAKRWLYNLLLAACILVFVGSGALLVQKILAQKKNDGRLENLSNLVAEAVEQEESAGMTAGTETKGGAEKDAETQAERELTPEEIRAAREARVKAYGKIKEQNPDLVGWVKVEGTKIDYPVLQSLWQPNFYLDHNFDKAYSRYGAPYVAEECDLTADCPNILVYGHHMKNGSMFAALDGYTEKSFFKEHPVIQFDTLEEYGDYQVMGAFTMSAVDQNNPLYSWITGGNQEAFENYVSYVKQHSFYDTGVEAQWGDHLVSLITCEYTHQDGRLIVVGKRIEKDGAEAGKTAD